ncbi:MAG: hypothetical protein EPO61_15330 [Nitrospirae bacterium]|nr:MAG: hypothetical protein EPO61_15330 [Nitrospirota bacterium]
MAEDHLLDLKESSSSIWLHVWRCMNCGEVVDAHIVERRTWLRLAGRSSAPASGRGPRRRHVAIRLGP